MPDESCITCKFSRIIIKDKEWPHERKVLVCCRYAPRWNSGVGTGAEMNLFPTVDDETWCGEWEYGGSNVVESK